MTISDAEVQLWDAWNSKYRQGGFDDQPSKRRMSEILASLADLKIHGANILEVGCGTGWLSSKLCEFGKVTAVDLGKEIIETAKVNYPEIDFRSGDVQTLDLPLNSFDVIVTLEVLSHAPNQPALVHRMAELLRPGGFLLITTQNKYVFERRADIGPPGGWIRKWVAIKTLKRFLRPEFSLRRITTLEPEGHLGLLRAINSRRINRYFNAVFGASKVKLLKESFGFGQTIFVVAVKRQKRPHYW
ncbi:MAG: class I SAM-dependent methyltransferase [Candidatus Acidiferrum sp.]